MRFRLPRLVVTPFARTRQAALLSASLATESLEPSLESWIMAILTRNSARRLTALSPIAILKEFPEEKNDVPTRSWARGLHT